MDQATAELWMREALGEARKAEAEGEVPVGAILLLHEKVIGRGHNSPIHDPGSDGSCRNSCAAAGGATLYKLQASGFDTRRYC